MLKKIKIAALVIVAAVAVTLAVSKPARASVVGSWMFRQLYVYAGLSSGNAAGLFINSGTPGAPTALSVNILGAIPTSARPASPVEGQIIYDSTLHKLGFYDGTSFKTAVWTTY